MNHDNGIYNQVKDKVFLKRDEYILKTVPDCYCLLVQKWRSTHRMDVCLEFCKSSVQKILWSWLEGVVRKWH
jgi:hypothetical protein